MFRTSRGASAQQPNSARERSDTASEIQPTPESGLARRTFIRSAAGSAALLAAGAAAKTPSTHKQSTARQPGTAMRGYGTPSRGEANIVRQRIRTQPGTTGSGASATPLEHLKGTLTPSGLHFERHHSGVPDLDRSGHRLTLAGLVRSPLAFTLDALERYPMVSRQQFLECSGNSAPQLGDSPLPWSCADIHGLVSCSEWTGVPLRYLLQEAGVDIQRKDLWVIAEGADAGRMNRSIPLAKCMDDALIALYQNGERLRPENGYPMRLFLPGYEGNMSIKWLHRLELSNAPAMSREETSKYTDLQSDGRARGFSFEMGVKSVLTSPSPGLDLHDHGVYPLSGLAWSGQGVIQRVEVSTDGGQHWHDADFDAPPQPLCFTRFSSSWHWRGEPTILLSRAIDSAGNQQPTRAQWLSANGANQFYHYNAIQAWNVAENGQVSNTYAS